MTALFDRSTCAALVITCSDFRFKAAERAFAETNGLGDDYDLIARPGGVRSIVVPRNTSAREAMEEEIRLLWTLHDFRRVVLLNHTSCRAYDDIAVPDTEVAVHTGHLLRAVPVVTGMLNNVEAEPYLLELAGGHLRARRVDQ